MAVELNINPNYVNIITDALLIVLSLVWAGMIEALTKLEVKKTLRLGQRIFSYEVLGTRAYLQFVINKFKRLQDDQSLSREEQRQFKWKIFRGAFFFAMGVCIVLIHILIDFGLGFDTRPQAGTNTAVYDMVEVRPDNAGAEDSDSRRLIRYLRELHDIDTVENAESTDSGCNGAISAQCQRSSEDRAQYYAENAREQINFARTTFESPGLKKLDVIQELTSEYTFAKAPGFEDDSEVDCNGEVESISGAEDYTGRLVLKDESMRDKCLLESTFLISVTFDLRASRSVLSTSFQRQWNGGTEANGSDDCCSSFEELDDVEYVSWQDSKDERQGITRYDVKGDVLGPEGLDNRRRVTVDATPGIKYVDDTNQTVTFASLTRDLLGTNVDFDFDFKRMFDREVAGEESDNCLFSNTQDRIENVSLVIDGVECGKFETNFLIAACKEEKIVSIDGQDYDHGKQGARGMVAIPGWQDDDTTDSEKCREELVRRYSSVLPLEKLESSLFVGYVHVDIICLEGNDSKKCMAGERRVKWNTEDQEFESASSADSGDDVFRARVELHWLLISVSDDSGRKTHKQALREIGDLLRTLYAQYQKFASFGWMSRNRILGLRMHQAMPLLIGAVSSQLVDAQRTLLVFDEVQIARLGAFYIYGVLSLLAALALLGIYTFSTFMAEYVAYRRLNLRVRVPFTATEWIAVALGQVSDSQYREPSNLFVYRKADTFEDDLEMKEEDVQDQLFKSEQSFNYHP